ncbi:hypothetical protein CBER1_04565 [Cercospora berteroae]|uniref:Uncharacterized protein n=1 Tax=Cercospora berteroae TaxID=357750 RepID=A0A2S6C238_9PEZI|nr:hypothetical protein CBER1_04565 [Cercospora berteroae]
MGLEDTFEFDGAAYRRRVKHMTPAELRECEIVKYRQTLCASWAMGTGVGAAFFTCGVSLIGTALGARRFKVATKKLEIVNAELASRNIPLYVTRKRDVSMSVTICLLTAGIGTAAAFLLLDTTSTATAGAFSSGGSANLTEAVHNPGEFVSGVVDEAAVQADQIMDIPVDGTHEGVAATDSIIIDANAQGVDTSAIALGMAAMQGLEIVALQSAVNPLAYQFICAHTEKRSQACSLATMEDCTHKMVPTCIQCAKKMDRATEAYYHCCRCYRQGYLFDACEPCLMQLSTGCRERDEHVLYRIAAAPQDMTSKGWHGKTGVTVTSTPVEVV